MKNLVVIPARKGSKRIKDKNIKLLNGKPLIEYTLEAAVRSDIDARIIVSTDSKKIQSIAKKNKVEVPFIRPEEFASDTATSFDVLLHSINYFEQKGDTFQNIMMLQPTSPLRTHVDIKLAYESFINSNFDSLVSVTRLSHPIEWCASIHESGSMEYFFKDKGQNKRSQDYSDLFYPNGAFYISKIDTFKQSNGFYQGSRTKAYVMPKQSSIDIDDLEDFQMAEALIQYQI